MYIRREKLSIPRASVQNHFGKDGLRPMSERLKMISKLRNDFDARVAYIKSKIGVIVPSKVKALRLKSNMPRQHDLAVAAKMHQSRISMFETPGVANLTLETLAKLAAAFKVGLIVDFVPFGEMLDWENRYSQDAFNVTRIDDDLGFLEEEPDLANVSNATSAAIYRGQSSNVSATTISFKFDNSTSSELVGAPPRRVAEVGHASQNQAAGGR